MSILRLWEIKYFDTSSSTWVKDVDIPRAGVENLKRTKESTIEFVTLADGSQAKVSSETASNWGDFDLVFPSNVVNETLKLQLQGYIDDEKPVRITIPVTTGASLFTKKELEGYLTNYIEEWPTGDKNQKYAVRVTLHEFDVD